ncbi:acyl-CoA dehydrogenase family protein [Rhodococcus qingshengii]|uniref:acyl-CoA dehydrogenase family protein n=1 Tax=Rhodococcus qingshengii TaxID=334542 RepID=UPI0010A685D9|nr:acyl-CoA dehydrogenase family protein [Rhodococcus qingshengii]THJ67678.1 hypothetical protein EU244_26160 [Rhodococcus qingshengii]
MRVDTEALIDYDEDGRQFADTSAEFVRREVAPNLDRWRSDGAVPKSFFSRAGETGLLGVQAPCAAGGLGVTDLRLAELPIRSLVDVGAVGTALAVGVHASIALPIIAAWGSGQSLELLSDLVSGDMVASVAGLNGKVELSDEGVLRGVAYGVPSAAIASIFLVVAEDEAGGSRIVCVEQDSAIVHHELRHLGAGDAGARTVEFDDVSVEAYTVLPDGATDDLLTRVAVLTGGISIMAAEFCLTRTVEYVNERQVFGRPVALFDNTRVQVGQMFAAIRMGRALHTAVLTHGDGSDSAAENAIALADRGIELYSRSADLGVQLHGGYGYMTEYPIAHAYAAARFLELVVRGLPIMQERLARAAGLVTRPLASATPRAVG